MDAHTSPLVISSYLIDDCYRILEIDQGFEEFAADNGAAVLNSGNLVGQSLFEYICNEETREIYRHLIDQVMHTQKSITVPFRCDSPATRRFMEIALNYEQTQRVRFKTRLLREEEREISMPPLAGSEQGNELLTMCSWCKKVVTDGEWMELEDAAIRLGLLETTKTFNITHGICGPCKAQLMKPAAAFSQR